MLCAEFGRAFSEDSSKAHQWEQSSLKGKMATFKKRLPFACHKLPADDLPHPGVLFRVINRQGTKVPVLIVELKSIHRIDMAPETADDAELQRKEFVSPLQRK